VAAFHNPRPRSNLRGKLEEIDKDKANRIKEYFKSIEAYVSRIRLALRESFVKVKGPVNSADMGDHFDLRAAGSLITKQIIDAVEFYNDTLNFSKPGKQCLLNTC